MAPKVIERRRADESGQTTIFVLLALGIFLLGAVAFAVDIANLWFHRQAAQNAADAACTAAAMDMLFAAQSTPVPASETSWGGFTAGTSFDCATDPTYAPCKYAKINGYDGAGMVTGTGGTQVKFTFPTGFTGVASCTGTPLPPVCLPGFLASAVVQVNVGEAVRVFFAGMLSGSRTMNVGAQATCGVVAAQSPIPLLVLDPVNPTIKPSASALNIQGNPTIKIVGGPTKSIEVNSNDAAAINTPWGSATIDLSKGGPSGTGSTLGVYGGPSTAPGGFNGGTTGSWQNSSPISDPFATLAAPSKPGTTPAPSAVASGVNGCPDPGGCYEYSAGDYPSGICVGNSCKGFKTYNTAIFDPGVYYLEGDFSLLSGSTVRPSTATGDGTGGTMFYLAGTSSVSVAANSGSASFTFSTTTGSGSLSYGVGCTSTSTVPSNLPASITGNVLLAPCTGTYGDPLVALGLTDPSGTQRGMLLFKDRSDTSSTVDWSGGGSLLLAGSMYVHSCKSSGAGTGCGAPPTYYNDIMKLGGNSGSSTYVLGNIIADNLNLGGVSGITMDLNPNSAYWILKASLLQ